jgi:DNA-directed RNA polymerase subunit RPC12/RpoP
MKCDRCGEPIPTGDEMDHYGETLCEECTMRALSPARACDPWAVRSAQRLSQLDDAYAALSETQTKILQVLSETGGTTPEVVAQKLELSLAELEREFATLRHMEKVRGQMRAGEKIICLWESERG